MSNKPEYDASLDAETTDALDLLTVTAKVETHQHIWTDGVYQGCLVTYANPLAPELKTMFHPYMPLVEFGKPTPKLTREYFLSNGLSVPGEEG